MAVRVLKDNGYTVLVANDGEEAIRLFETNVNAVNLALLDVVMPKLGGYAVYNRITAINPSLRVLFSSGYNNMAEDHSNLKEGIQLLSKPYTPHKLLYKVREALDA